MKSEPEQAYKRYLKTFENWMQFKSMKYSNFDTHNYLQALLSAKNNAMSKLNLHIPGVHLVHSDDFNLGKNIK